MIGWIGTIPEADAYYLTRSGAEDWAAFVDVKKTAALMTAYREISNSRMVSIPSPLTGEQLEKFKYAQLELALIHSLFQDGILKIKTLINYGVSSSRAMGESYGNAKDNGEDLPANILAILNDFVTGRYGYIAQGKAYRNLEDELKENQ